MVVALGVLAGLLATVTIGAPAAVSTEGTQGNRGVQVARQAATVPARR